MTAMNASLPTRHGGWAIAMAIMAITSVQAFLPKLVKPHTPSLLGPRQMSADTKTDSFLTSFYSSSECDDVNTPPSLSILLRSLQQLPSGSDIRGRFIDHSRVGSIASVAHVIGSASQGVAPLTPVAAHCFGYAFGRLVRERILASSPSTVDRDVIVAIGKDPRPHGSRLSDAFARGAQSVDGVRAVYTGVATTPAMFEFCRADLCDGGVMVTASHLPVDRNGFKFFTKNGGFNKYDVLQLVEYAKAHAQYWHDMGILPPTSGTDAVFCSEWVDHMPHYAGTLKNAIIREVSFGLAKSLQSSFQLPLAGLRIVLNAGNGSGGFFYAVLQELGADVSASINVEPDGNFPAGVPNPEYAKMIQVTTQVCEESNADLGIMLDTDADRCGFVVPRSVEPDGSRSHYEALNRNRLIALLGVIFSSSSPGCAVVTDSVTSEGLAKFLQQNLGLQHVRYLKGYANVISKARKLSESGVANAEMAIETSGHCAMKENGYLDDGTYTAVKVIGLLARVTRSRVRDGSQTSLLDLISDLEEMPEVHELRMNVMDGCLQSTLTIFDFAAVEIQSLCESNTIPEVSQWSLDKENLEGVRVRTGNGGFFMLRKSLHDPIISLQVEGVSKDEVRSIVVQPLLKIFSSGQVSKILDLSALQSY